MKLIKPVRDHVGVRPDKFFKNTLFESDAMLLGLNCLEPGQVQKSHRHEGQDKFYYVVEGAGSFQLGKEEIQGQAGDVIWAPAGLEHGVHNRGATRLTLLVGIAPAP